MKPYTLYQKKFSSFFAIIFFLFPLLCFAGEGEISVVGEIDYHVIFEEGGRSGVGLGFEAGYGINDSFGLMTQLKGAFFFGGEEDASTRLFASAGLGVSFALDVFRAIPLVTVLPTVYQFEDLGGEKNFSFGLQVGLSIDYLLSRKASIGALLGGYQYRADPALDQNPDSFFAGIRGGLIFSP